MTENTRCEKTFLLCAAYLAAGLAGAWLGLAAATVTGMAVSEPPRFPGEARRSRRGPELAPLRLLAHAANPRAKRARQIRVRNPI